MRGSAAYWQAWPNPVDNTQGQEITNIQDLHPLEKEKKRGSMFRRVTSFLFLFSFFVSPGSPTMYSNTSIMSNTTAPLLSTMLPPCTTSDSPSSIQLKPINIPLYSTSSLFTLNPLLFLHSHFPLVNYKIMYKGLMYHASNHLSSCFVPLPLVLCVHSKSLIALLYHHSSSSYQLQCLYSTPPVTHGLCVL